MTDSKQSKKGAIGPPRAGTSLSGSSSARSINKKKSNIVKVITTGASVVPKFEIEWLKNEYI